MTAAAPAAEILASGSELLAGEVQDTNTRCLARAVTGLGGVVTRALVLPADAPALEAAAAAAGVPLEEHPAAREMVAARYADLAARGWVADAALGPERLKMARLPRGARPVPNPVGAAPGVVLECGTTTVIALPGVPAELEAMVEGPLRPVLSSILGPAAYCEDAVVVLTGDESAVAPAVAEAAGAFPSVRVKSRARRFGPDVRITVTPSARGASEPEARDILARCRGAFLAACASRGLRAGA